ncbi:MAG TPA: cysteine--tRNA ligase [Candidatus Angelobacter sp.]|nr:cysteine--tRNA ligase [Candidatus Angelobacter sp.]
MGLKFFNTLTRSVQEFVPLDPSGKKIAMYCCGPTVHDFAHIGNFRTFVFADLVRRYLEFKGVAVTHVMNITDVEDKIIKRVRESGGSLHDYTGKYESAFLADLETLGCLRPHQMPRATEHIPDIISLIERLVARGIAYRAADGSVYFSIEKYRGCGCRYGQLVNLNFDEMRPGERVSSDDYAKESIADFALWKARVAEDGDVFWPSPWGEGRPGWHIECSAMSMKVLGESFDLHLGGEDLIFPHHEDEIAQSEGATGKPFVKYWLHGAHLLVEGKKMSKSLGNFYTLRDLTEKHGFNGREIRYLLLTAHYRESFNFTLEGLQGARKSLARIEECLSKLLESWDEVGGNVHAPPDATIVSRFADALDDDLNVSKAWGAIFDWIRELNRSIAGGKLSRDQAATAIVTWKLVDSVFGLSFRPESSLRMSEAKGIVPFGLLIDLAGETSAPAEVKQLAMERIKARKAKDFKRSDAIRDELKAKGWVIEDTPKGPRLKRA